MEYGKWIRLDNASNIFLAARNDIDTKVFRLTAEMSDKVDSAVLQEALNQIYEEYPLFHNILRRGFFWYYLEESSVNPRVKIETEPPLRPLYKANETDFLFRILYKKNQIHLEVFHALTDGTGALWFFEDLITEYVRLRYAKQKEGLGLKAKREKEDLEDSFSHYFKEKKKVTQFDRFIRPLTNIYKEQRASGSLIAQFSAIQTNKKIYQVKGTLTPDHRSRIINVEMPIKDTLTLTRNEGVSLTIYMTAVYILAAYQAVEKKEKETTISVSIPINLRQFFPSVTVRNFFSTTTVAYTFKEDEPIDFNAICQNLDQQFKKQLERESLESRMKKNIEFEYHPAARTLLRPIKDLILKGINKLNNRKITLAMSNLGRVNLPEEMTKYVDNLYFYTSVIRPQFCMISYNQTLNVSFTSPFTETEIFKNFVQYLTSEGLAVTVDSNKVTKEELEAE